MKKTQERIIPKTCKRPEKKLLYLKHFFAYYYAAKLYKKGSVLDVGCGEGYGTYFLSRRCKEVIGIDTFQDTINHCKKTYRSKNLEFYKYDGKKIPFSNNSFDIITCFQVIEHVKEEALFLREIKRILKADGTALFTTPYRVYRLKKGQSPWNKFHIREYYIFQLRKVLKKVFPSVKICGITARKPIRNIEYSRVGYIKKTKDYGRKHNFKTNDFFVIRKNLKISLDLLGICGK
jgi:2-polyprenyl-3-methyl-5-hydroxy-6-metoxy-1,4-benzoquinol methylase